MRSAGRGGRVGCFVDRAGSVTVRRDLWQGSVWVKRWGWIVAVMTVMITVVGCGSSLGAEGEPPIAENPPALTSFADTAVPLRAYLLSGSQIETILNGQEVLTARCARGFDYEYIPITYPPHSQLGEDYVYLPRRYGLINVEMARMHGYAPSPEDQPVLVSEEFLRRPDPSPREAEVLQGPAEGSARNALKASDGALLPEGGCRKEAWRQIGPATSNMRKFVVEGIDTAYRQMRADSRALAAEADFVTCMQGRGYPEFRKFGDIAAGDERTAAVDQAECAQEANLPGIWYAVDSAYQQRWIDKHEAELRQGAADREVALRRAQQAIAEGV